MSLLCVETMQAIVLLAFLWKKINKCIILIPATENFMGLLFHCINSLLWVAALHNIIVCHHLIPLIRYFLWKLMTVLLMEETWYDAYTWPLLVFLFSCCVYPLASSCAHTFSTMSTRARHICYFFDYGALSLYSLGKRGTHRHIHFNALSSLDCCRKDCHKDKVQGLKFCSAIFNRNNGGLAQLMQIQITLHSIQQHSIFFLGMQW